VEVAEIEEVHVGRRIETAQRAVQIDRCGLERDRHALGNHHLHAVASQDVVLDAVDGLLVVLAAEAGAKGRLGAVALFEIQAQARRDRLAQLRPQRVQASLTGLVGFRLRRVDQHDAVQLAGEVVEYHHGVGNHQQDIRCAQRIRVGAIAKFALDIAHAVVAEIADQPAVEARQAFDRRDAVALLEGFDEGQRILDLTGLGLDAIGGHADAVIPHAQHGAARQTDD